VPPGVTLSVLAQHLGAYELGVNRCLHAEIVKTDAQVRPIKHLSMYVCVHACMYVCVCVFSMHVCVCMCVYMCIASNNSNNRLVIFPSPVFDWSDSVSDQAVENMSCF
jgi:hypothetical protein